MDDQQRVLEYLRENAPNNRSAPAMAVALDLDEGQVRRALLGLELDQLVRAGRGAGGATAYYAVQPNTWIAWK